MTERCRGLFGQRRPGGLAGLGLARFAGVFAVLVVALAGAQAARSSGPTNVSGTISSTTSGTSTSYSYDGDGNRLTSNTSGGASLFYSWDSQAPSGIPELALEQTGSGALIRRYLDGPNGAVSMTNSGGVFYYGHDPLGSVSDLTDATGAAQWAYSYEPYGAARSSSNVSGSAPENPLQFDSQYLDSQTSQYNLRAREYDPATARFGALDPLESPLAAPSAGAYVYVDGRPTLLDDQLGLSNWLTDNVLHPAAHVLTATANAADDAGLGLAHNVADTYHGARRRLPSIRQFSDLSAGFGDTFTFGATEQLRRLMGTDDVVNHCSWSYRIGGATAIAAQTALSVGALQAGRAARLAAEAESEGGGIFSRLVREERGSVGGSEADDGPNLIYEHNLKHGPVARQGPQGEISRAPRGDCQAMLECSTRLGPKLRSGVEPETGLEVIFRRHRVFENTEWWHGYVPGG